MEGGEDNATVEIADSTVSEDQQQQQQEQEHERPSSAASSVSGEKKMRKVDDGDEF